MVGSQRKSAIANLRWRCAQNHYATANGDNISGAVERPMRLRPTIVTPEPHVRSALTSDSACEARPPVSPLGPSEIKPSTTEPALLLTRARVAAMRGPAQLAGYSMNMALMAAGSTLTMRRDQNILTLKEKQLPQTTGRVHTKKAREGERSVVCEHFLDLLLDLVILLLWLLGLLDHQP